MWGRATPSGCHCWMIPIRVLRDHCEMREVGQIGPLAGSFFLKRVLLLLVGLGMTRTRSQLAPTIPMQETGDAIDMHFMYFTA
jgi:hypothetical protein